MKYFLIFSSVFIIGCNSNRIAVSHLPESGWSRQHVMKFMEGQYKFISLDTANGLGGETCITSQFAPVLFYGIEGIFSVLYDNNDSVYSAGWNSGCKSWEKPWPDTRLNTLFKKKLTTEQIGYLLDTLSREKGSPDKKQYDGGQIEYTWSEGERGNMLGITKERDVFYLLYWKNGIIP